MNAPVLYPDQHFPRLLYTANEVQQATRQFDHPTEPSWGVYTIEGFHLCVLADCDYEEANQ
jgi:hypothetical protein